MKQGHVEYVHLVEHKVLCLFSSWFCFLCCEKPLLKFQRDRVTNHWLGQLERNGKLLA